MAKNAFATFGILAVLLMSLGMVSAAVTLDIIEGELTGEAGDVIPFTINLTSNETVEVYVNWTAAIPSRITDLADEANYTTGSHNVSGFKLTVPTSGQTTTVRAHVYNASDLSELYMVPVTVNFDVTEAPVEEPEEESACVFDLEVTENGDLEISDFDVNNLGEGDDDAWEYMDTIEVEVEIENTNNDDDVDDVEVKMIILDEEGEDVTGDFDLEDEIITSIGRLKDDDQETVLFTIDVSPEVLAGDYSLYIVAYSDGEEELQCISKIDGADLYFEFSIEPVEYEDSIVVKESDLGSSKDTFCGEKNLEITIPVYNLYDEDQEKILVNLYNSELGIDEYQVINDLNDRDSEHVTFFVNIPEFLDKEKYDLDVILNFDWDDDEDEDSEFSYEEQNTKTSLRLNILGCRVPAPSMKPTLESEAQAGTELVVKALITNNGEDNTFIIDASGYESWAELISVTPQGTDVAEGQFVEATVVLMPTITGMHSFVISATIGDDTFNQPVSVNIKEAKGFFGLSGMTLYLVAGIAGMLLLILVALIVKVSKKKVVKAQF